MERFLKRHKDRIVGTIAGFDRILFRGTMLSICHVDGLNRFLSSQQILYKDFGEFAQRISGCLKNRAQELAKEAGREYRYLNSAAVSKEQIARQIAERDRISEGLVCVLACVEPCQSFDIRRGAGLLKLVSLQRQCLHFYFYYLDAEFGWMHLRLQSWFPLTMQVCLNGREYLARALEREGIGYEQRDNCFVRIDDLKRAQALLDRLHQRKWERVLNAFAKRVNPWLDRRARPQFYGYYWTVRQAEYATDLMFRDTAALAEIYPALARHAIETFRSKDVLRFLGRRTNSRFQGEVTSKYPGRVEGLCVKHWVEENSIKIYDKQGSVLRVETTINNPKRFRVYRPVKRAGKDVKQWATMRKGVADLPRRVELSRAANARYIEALSVVGETKPSHRILDQVSRRVELKGRPYRALHPVSPEDSQIFRAVMAGEAELQGIRNQDIRRALEPHSETDQQTFRRASARTTRRLRLLTAHGLIYKVAHTSYYRITTKGHEVMATALKFRAPEMALLAA